MDSMPGVWPGPRAGGGKSMLAKTEQAVKRGEAWENINGMTVKWQKIMAKIGPGFRAHPLGGLSPCGCRPHCPHGRIAHLDPMLFWPFGTMADGLWYSVSPGGPVYVGEP